MKIYRHLIAIACAVTSIMGVVVPSAYAAACNGQVPFDHAGWLDFLNYGPNGNHQLNFCGKVRGNNPNWGDEAVMGSNWNDKADLFKNNDAVRRVTVYQQAGYNEASILDIFSWQQGIVPGQTIVAFDIVSSNRWD